MSFSPAEIEYLASQPLARLATRKLRNILHGNREVALVVDDLVSFDPFVALERGSPRRDRAVIRR